MSEETYPTVEQQGRKADTQALAREEPETLY
jgi:hypothetical protein